MFGTRPVESEAEVGLNDWHIGSFDGSTWTDEEKVLVGGVDLASAGEGQPIGLAVSKGTLVLGSDDEGDADTGLLVSIPGTNLAGTYTSLDSGSTVIMLTKGGLVAA